jgi:hypothetical protein
VCAQVDYLPKEIKHSGDGLDRMMHNSLLRDHFIRARRGQDFVLGGYIANDNTVDSLLVGYYDGRDLM